MNDRNEVRLGLCPTCGQTPKGSLSPRECEVMELMVEGRTYHEIAEGLGISDRTVGNHLTAAYAKLEVSNRVQAVVKFLDLKAEADRAAAA